MVPPWKPMREPGVIPGVKISQLQPFIALVGRHEGYPASGV